MAITVEQKKDIGLLHNAVVETRLELLRATHAEAYARRDLEDYLSKLIDQPAKRQQ